MKKAKNSHEIEFTVATLGKWFQFHCCWKWYFAFQLFCVHQTVDSQNKSLRDYNEWTKKKLQQPTTTTTTKYMPTQTKNWLWLQSTLCVNKNVYYLIVFTASYSLSIFFALLFFVQLWLSYCYYSYAFHALCFI